MTEIEYQNLIKETNQVFVRINRLLDKLPKREDSENFWMAILNSRRRMIEKMEKLEAGFYTAMRAIRHKSKKAEIYLAFRQKRLRQKR